MSTEYLDVDYRGWRALSDQPPTAPAWANETVVEEHPNETLTRYRYLPDLAPAEVDASGDDGRLRVEVETTHWREFAAGGQPLPEVSVTASYPLVRLVLERDEGDEREGLWLDQPRGEDYRRLRPTGEL